MIPPWLVILVGSLVTAFGLFRLRLGLRSREAEQAAIERGGLYGLRRRTHLLVGSIYVLAGVMLILSAFGIRPPFLPGRP